ncbi:MAG TPA: PAS domain-containing protein, partial [Chitinophagales bacterium]|nr:PAS domain-containing protein [Chitinophagales bacterium]
FNEGDGEIETNLITKTGDKIPYYYKGHVENIEGKSFFIGVGIDISARKKAEESHRESEANLKRAELVAKLGHWKMNLNDKMIYGSEGTMQIYGIDKPVISYNEAAQLRMPEYDEVMNNAMEALLRYNKPLDVEYKMKRKSDGQILDIRLLSEFDVKSETLFGIVQDITDRKNAERETQESEKKYRLLFHNNPLPMFMVSLPSYQFADVNETAVNHYGYSREEFLSMRVRDLWPADDKAAFEKELPGQLTGTNFLGKWKHVKKNGELCMVELTVHEVKLGDERQRLVLVNDVTEREEALEKLKKNINELSVYKAALDEAAIIAITDQHGIINHVNDNFCTVSKYSREELIGADHRIINSGHHSKEFMHDLWQTIAQGKIWTGEIKNKTKDGNYYWVHSTIIPFLNEEDKPYQYLSIRWDITTRKNAEEEIQRLYNKLLVANDQLTTVLNTLPANIAVLDAQGKITSVNKAWQQFAESNNLPGNKHAINDNYITACEQNPEDAPIALKMAESIRQILKGELDELSLEYPCHSPTEKRWFRAEVRPLAEEGNTGAVVMHVNITER